MNVVRLWIILIYNMALNSTEIAKKKAILHNAVLQMCKPLY